MIRTCMNRGQHKKDYEINRQPSLTVPDQDMSIAEILKRFTRGEPIAPIAKPYYYEEDPENDFIPDIKRLDLAEVQQLKMFADQRIQELRQEIKTTGRPPSEPATGSQEPQVTE